MPFCKPNEIYECSQWGSQYICWVKNLVQYVHTPASEESKQHEEIVSISSFFSLSHTFLYLLDFNFFLLLSMSLLLVELFRVSFFPAVSLLFWPRPFVPLTQSIHFFFWSQRICWLLYIKFFFMISLLLFFLFHSFISFLFSAAFPFHSISLSTISFVRAKRCLFQCVANDFQSSNVRVCTRPNW